MLVDHLPDLSGKLICIYMTGRSQARYILQDVSFDIQGGRLFVVGRIPEDYDKYVTWAKGKPAAIAWDCVDYYILFESVEQFRESLGGSREIPMQPAAEGFMSNWLRKRK